MVEVGERVSERLAQLESQRPIGMALDTVYNQSHEVDKTVQGFLINLVESIAIVIGVLLLFMGLRSGLLMGLILLLTILGTFIVMKVLGIDHDKLNVNGGACALGHPIGASGSRIIVTLLHALQQRGGKKGVASLCIGGGEATAMAIELV